MLTPASSPAARRRAALVCGAAAVLLSAACAPAPQDRAVEAPGVGGTERELAFEGGGHEVSASFRTPEGVSGTVPGALIISGSGPTDRDGNSDMRPDADTNLNLSRVLADAGVASLRYDKYGSGPDFEPPESSGGVAPVDPLIFDEQVAAAYDELVSQPEVDPERVVVVGHSEGALYALRAHELVGGDRPSPALVLAAPPGTRYLDLIDRQLTEQVRVAEALGQVEEGRAVGMLSDARAARAAVRAGRPLRSADIGATPLQSVYSPANEDFLAYMDSFDPVELGEDLPEGTPVLVLWGEEDAQVSREDVDRLMTGLEDAERVDVPGADHILRRYEDQPGATVLDSQRPFAEEVSPALEEFLESAW
ncbi:alpha/beta hydrolase [Nocardiopsis sp. TSRI0078]|uniref:alpha/beta hydrolase family protein n=1 Tax=unclassified Nocardiopsis TaxID=2649073 RepID=UPI00093CEE36|nr:alpha/beta hydrolase [Nocardiopsis sp. TSRI0078]OKI15627.1 alpha/beta hydrolase [Nocardiopsis sp. TSRI0078]